jgi:AAA domain/DnaB-like helicase N terminal domain
MNSINNPPRLPVAAESEKYVLGCLLVDPECADKVTGQLRPEDFASDRAHQAIFATAQELFRRDGSIDPRLIAVELSGDSLFAEAGPAGYLLELAQGVATFAYLTTHVGQLREATTKRRLHRLTTESSADALNGKPASEILSNLCSDLDDLRRDHREVPVIVSAASIESRAIDWLWPGRLPCGMLTILDGDPGTGKSQIACYLAGCLTYPRPYPYAVEASSQPAGNVLMLAGEDGPDTTIRPRLEAVGADLDRVFFWPELSDPISLPSGVERLRTAVEAQDIRLLVIDPISAYLDGSINTNRDADVRRALRPLGMLAQETNVAILLIRHLNKDASKSALYRGGGSIGFIGSARMAWLVANDPEKPDRLVLAINKTNIARRAPSLLYSIESVGGTSRIRWEGESNQTAAQILAVSRHTGGKRADAEQLISVLLASGPKPASDVWAVCEAAGIREATYRAARRELNVKPIKTGMDDGWKLLLPEAELENDAFG